MEAEKREALKKLIEKELNTVDKRYMYLQLLFPDELKFIDLEGCGWVFSSQLINEFKKRNLLSSLYKSLKNRF